MLKNLFQKKRTIVEIGKPAPGFSLPDENGDFISLSDYRNKNNLLLIFIRPNWCPSCHIQLRTYKKHYQEFIEKQVIILAIGSDPAGVNKEIITKLGIEFKILSDTSQKIAKEYAMQIIEEHNMSVVAHPALFFIDKNSIVRYVMHHGENGEFLNDSVFHIIDSLQEISS